MFAAAHLRDRSIYYMHLHTQAATHMQAATLGRHNLISLLFVIALRDKHVIPEKDVLADPTSE